MRLFERIPFWERAVIAFIAFVALFAFFHGEISDLGTNVLVKSGELPASALKRDASLVPSLPGTENTRTTWTYKERRRWRVDSKSSQQAYLDAHPRVTLLPYTVTPSILFAPDLDRAISEAPPFPPLRLYEGTGWSGERTVVRAVTDGKILRISCMLFDKSSGGSVSGQVDSAEDGDSVEIFLTAGFSSKTYWRYVLSVSGSSEAARYEKLTSPRAGRLLSGNSDSKLTVSRTPDGFLLRFDIPVSEFKDGGLSPGDTILGQVARICRRAGDGSNCLQLFPTHIYADNRFGADNHDRRAFRPLRVVGEGISSRAPQLGKEGK